MATLSSSKVPIKVQHSPNTSGMNESYYSRTSRVQSPAPFSTLSFDEPDGIKTRMKEFEERCKKWREEFFAKNPNNFGSISAFPADFDTSFTTPSSRLSGGTPFTTAQPPDNLSHFGSVYQPLKSPTFSSSLHKSFVEDTRDGKKVYKVEFEVGDFKENELLIKTQGNLLIIKGDREIKVGGTTETKTFNREITIPDYINTNNLNAFLTGTTLTVEAPINNDAYYQRRSDLNSASSTPASARFNSEPAVTLNDNYSPLGTIKSSKIQQASTSHYSSSKTSPSHPNASYLISLQPPEATGYQNYYSKDDNSTTYKFDLKEFNQTDIHLSITENRVLEIKASREINDTTGKTYREFKREIQLDQNADLNSISNVLSSDGVLTLKIPYKQPLNSKLPINKKLSLTTNDSLKTDLNNNNADNNSYNNFQEHFSKVDGKLIKLTYDLKDYEPENLKIVLTPTNELKISAHINEANKSGSQSETKIQKQCFRQYNLPSYIQPEQMKAVMSRDGLLTIDFSGAKNSTTVNQEQLSQQFDSHVNLKTK
jgi:HSP20 family molecular chaperone IbpA